MNAELHRFVELLFSESEYNRLPERYGGGPFFSAPLMGVASGDDPIFQRYKEVVGTKALTPAELWAADGMPGEGDMSARLRVVSIVFPYVDRIREANRGATDIPAEIYCVGRNYADDFIADVLKRTVTFLEERGCHSVAGVLSPTFRVMKGPDPTRIYSTWSERHMAFAAGLGTFSLHEALITEAGCNVRLGSVVTDAPLDVTPRVSDDAYGNCLHYAKGTCGKCIETCPADSVRSEGRDKAKCMAYRKKVMQEMTKRVGSILRPRRPAWGGRDFAVGCALCQFNVPCMSKNPMA